MKIDVVWIGRGDYLRRPIPVKSLRKIESDARWYPRWKLLLGSLAVASMLTLGAVVIAVFG